MSVYDLTNHETIELEQRGDHGWEWTIQTYDEDGDRKDSRCFRTSGDGDGLWLWHDRQCDWKQTAGTCQYSLPSDEIKALKRILRDAGLRLTAEEAEAAGIKARDVIAVG